jgi:hypothetical protein
VGISTDPLRCFVGNVAPVLSIFGIFVEILQICQYFWHLNADPASEAVPKNENRAGLVTGLTNVPDQERTRSLSLGRMAADRVISKGGVLVVYDSMSVPRHN